MSKIKAVGSAVLTALQAQSKSVEEIIELAKERAYKANMKGTTTNEWTTSFWTAIGILEATKIYEKLL